MMRKKQVRCVDCGFLAFLKGIPYGIATGPLEQLKLLKELGYYDYLECKQNTRDDISRRDIAPPLGGSELVFGCSRHVWWEFELGPEDGDMEKALRDILKSERQCPYFFPYQPGFTPTEHKELQRDTETQGLLMKGMIWAAVVGAVIGGLVSALVSSLASGQ